MLRTTRQLRSFVLIFASSLVVSSAFMNCSGFSAKEIQSLQLASNFPNGGQLPVPTPTPTPYPGSQKVFMASGNVGRTIMSCDDGKTWINNRSDDDSVRCNTTDPGSVDCTHTGQAAINLDAGDGMFFADYGWGAAGSVRKSADGVNWTILKSDSWGGGVLYSLGKMFVDWGAWFLSSDLGATWTTVVAPPVPVRDDHSHSYRLGAKFVVVGRDAGMAVSYDQGQTWEMPQGYLSQWGSGGVAEGNGLQVSIGYSYDSTTGKFTNYSARSTDNGHTWSGRTIDPASQYFGWDQLLFNGKEFQAFSVLGTWKSTDGISWTAAPIQYSEPVNMNDYYGKVAMEPSTGTYVMITGKPYQYQRAARSTDGASWTFIAPANFVGSHPINTIISADMLARYCPH